MIISSKPFHSIKTIFKGHTKNARKIKPLYFNTGRDAFLFGLIEIGIKKNDKIIVPSYICASSIEKIIEYGVEVIYLDVNKDLTFSLSALKKISESSEIKAILVVNFFGYKNDYKEYLEYCKNKKIKLVLDNCHCSITDFARDDFDKNFDMVFYSLRKSLPVIDGGALIINNGSAKNKKISKASNFLGEVKFFIARSLEYFLIKIGVNIYSTLIDFLRKKNQSKKIRIFHKSYKKTFLLEKYINDFEYLLASETKIKRNYSYLFNYLKSSTNIDLYRKFTHDDNAPQGLILLDSNKKYLKQSRKKGIGSWAWPDYELPTYILENSQFFPNTIELNQKITVIPIHQSLNKKDINYICHSFRGISN